MAVVPFTEVKLPHAGTKEKMRLTANLWQGLSGVSYFSVCVCVVSHVLLLVCSHFGAAQCGLIVSDTHAEVRTEDFKVDNISCRLQ